MDQATLIRGIDRYRDLQETDPERSRAFRDDIQPFIEDMINGVFLTLRIHHEDEEFLKDLKQTLYLKVIPGFEKEGKGIRSIKNYLYIKIRNETVNYLVSSNRRRDFYKKITNIIESDSESPQNLINYYKDPEPQHPYKGNVMNLRKGLRNE